MSRRITLLVAVAALVALIAALPSAVRVSAASSNLFANVDGAGNLLSGNGVSSVSHIGTGRYEVTFSSDVSGCAYVASSVNAHSQALLVFTAGGHSSVNGVYVETKNQGGGLTDGPFDLVVDCGGTGLQYAVVGYTENLVRSSGASLSHLGVGRYDVTFAADVSRCAYLASVGDPSNAIALAPNNVSTGSGPNAQTVYIETKNPGGGLADGIPFHLAVVCPGAQSAKVLVVRNSGVPIRGTSLTSAFKASTGNFVFATNTPISACAVIGTRGSVNTAVPFNPATVEITSGPAPNTTGIQVRTLLFFGGGLTNEAFHAAAVC
jgi:hypothetical protein